MQTNTTIDQVSAAPNIENSERSSRRWIMGIGIATMAFGIGAIALPFMATLAIELLVGIALVVAGGMQITHGLSAQLSKETVFRIFAGAAYGAVGLFLTLFPVQGAMTLTILLAMLFVLVGTVKIALALHMHPLAGWGWLLFNGVVATVLGVLIWAHLPSAAAWAIGLLVGIDLLLSGWIIVLSAKAMREDGSVTPLGKGSL